MLIRNAEIDGKSGFDLRCCDGLIEKITARGVLQPAGDETVLEANGAALLPGLHDHHLHLLALAAAEDSVDCGPPAVNNRNELAQAFEQADATLEKGEWLRGVAYHDSVAGELDRWQLDKLLADRPLRIQHRSGKLWILNSLALELLGIEHLGEKQLQDHPGIERTVKGQANGRLFRMDAWLQEQLQEQLREKRIRQSRPDVSVVSRRLAGYGVTGITDATPNNSAQAMSQWQQDIEQGRLLQRVLLMGDARLPESGQAFIERGAVKLLLDEYQLPAIDDFEHAIRVARQLCRPVAIHCVTRAELVYALSALSHVGGFAGDRIEHASICPDAVLALLQESGVAVVTQPSFVYERGDQYLEEVEPRFHSELYRTQALLSAGIPLAGSSDAPYGDPNPWLGMRAAVARKTRSGLFLGQAESLSPEQALALYTSSATAPGTVPRRVAVGAIADLCLLKCPWWQAREQLSEDNVVATLRAGELIYTAG